MRSILVRLTLLGALVSAMAGCGTNSPSNVCAGVQCGEACCQANETCVDGVCQAQSPCNSADETDTAFCARLHKECGSVTAADLCGVVRTVADCGICTATGTSCSAEGRCVCEPKADEQLCSEAHAACGPLEATDNCGAAHSVASCGTGTGTGTGEACEANACICHPKTNDELCVDAGAVCGPIAVGDNCGAARTVESCGTCTGTGEACEAGTCVCHPNPGTQLCADAHAVCGALAVTERVGNSNSRIPAPPERPIVHQPCGAVGAAVAALPETSRGGRKIEPGLLVQFGPRPSRNTSTHFPRLVEFDVDDAPRRRDPHDACPTTLRLRPAPRTSGGRSEATAP